MKIPMKIFKYLKRVWNYFFETRVSSDPPLPVIKYKYRAHEVKFFDPVSTKEKFNKSKTLKDFIHKIDTNE